MLALIGLSVLFARYRSKNRVLASALEHNLENEEQAKTLRARSRDEAYPEVDQVYDQYRVK